MVLLDRSFIFIVNRQVASAAIVQIHEPGRMLYHIGDSSYRILLICGRLQVVAKINAHVFTSFNIIVSLKVG